MKNILIVGVMEPEALRTLFEDSLARRFEERGIKGISSYSVFPEETMPDRKQIESRVRELHVDSVIIARLVDTHTIQAYETYPPYVDTGTIRGYYALCCTTMISSGYDVTFETRVFRAKDDRAIWSALSRVAFRNTPKNMVRMTNEFVTALTGALRKDGLII